MNHTFEKIDNIMNKVSNGVTLIAQGVLFLMMLLVTCDVIGRYFFNRAITGSIELIELMMILVVFTAIGYSTRKGGHVVVDFVSAFFSDRICKVFDIFGAIVSSVVVGFIVWQMGKEGCKQLLSSQGTTTLQLNIPEAPFIILAAIGSLIMFIENLIHIFHCYSEVRNAGR